MTKVRADQSEKYANSRFKHAQVYHSMVRLLMGNSIAVRPLPRRGLQFRSVKFQDAAPALIDRNALQRGRIDFYLGRRLRHRSMVGGLGGDESGYLVYCQRT